MSAVIETIEGRERQLRYEEALEKWLACECSEDPRAECPHRRTVREIRASTFAAAGALGPRLRKIPIRRDTLKASAVRVANVEAERLDPS
jgi:hypothetical protein